jgi:hypothetical protein
MDDVVSEVLGRADQTVIDEVMELVRTGETEKAVALLLEREGRWLTRERAEEFVRTTAERMSGAGP